MLQEDEDQMLNEFKKDEKAVRSKPSVDKVDNVLKTLLPKMKSHLLKFELAIQYLLKASLMQQEQINRLNDVVFPGGENNVCYQGPIFNSNQVQQY